MGKLKGRRPSPALLVAVVALVAALSGVAVAGVAVTSLNKKDRKQVRKIAKKQAKKQSKKAVKGIPAGPEGPAGPKGDPGSQGATGEPGEDATNLFAYVRDNGDGVEADLDYGEGATGVSDPPGHNGFGDPYVVTFNRDLTGCVAHSTAGLGEPDEAEPGDVPALGVTAASMLTDIEGSSVETFAVQTMSGLVQDTSFVLSVFC